MTVHRNGPLLAGAQALYWCGQVIAIIVAALVGQMLAPHRLLATVGVGRGAHGSVSLDLPCPGRVRRDSDEASRQQPHPEVDAGIGTLKEFYVWKNNPCSYSAAGYQKPQDCYVNNPSVQIWKVNKPPSDLLGRAGMVYTAGNNDQIVRGAAGALAGIGSVVAVPVAGVGLGINVAAEGAWAVTTSLFSAFGGIAGPDSALAAAAGIGTTSWAGVVAGPAAIIIAGVVMGVSQGIAVIESE